MTVESDAGGRTGQSARNGWALINMGFIPGVRPFDPFPFGFLILVVSLEAIFLSVFVLMSQNRMTRQADKRAHLDLQIDRWRNRS